MQSPTAMTELPSPNLAGTFFAPRCRSFMKIRPVVGCCRSALLAFSLLLGGLRLVAALAALAGRRLLGRRFLAGILVVLVLAIRLWDGMEIID